MGVCGGWAAFGVPPGVGEGEGDAFGSWCRRRRSCRYRASGTGGLGFAPGGWHSASGGRSGRAPGRRSSLPGVPRVSPTVQGGRAPAFSTPRPTERPLKGICRGSTGRAWGALAAPRLSAGFAVQQGQREEKPPKKPQTSGGAGGGSGEMLLEEPSGARENARKAPRDPRGGDGGGVRGKRGGLGRARRIRSLWER